MWIRHLVYSYFFLNLAFVFARSSAISSAVSFSLGLRFAFCTLVSERSIMEFNTVSRVPGAADDRATLSLLFQSNFNSRLLRCIFIYHNYFKLSKSRRLL